MYQAAGIGAGILTVLLSDRAKNQALSVRETIAADCKSKGVNGLSFTDGGL